MASIIHVTRLTSASSEQVDLNVLISTGATGHIKDTLAKSVTPPAEEEIHSFLRRSPVLVPAAGSI